LLGEKKSPPAEAYTESISQLSTEVSLFGC